MNSKVYYHYCSIETFYSIINHSTLRMGNPLYMNDSVEVIWLLKLIKKNLKKEGKYIEIVNAWSEIEEIVKSIIHELDLPYIVCFSKKGDVLSQWRAYADDGYGVAIGFDIEKLIEANDKTWGESIIYDEIEQMRILNAIKEEKFKEWEEVIKGKDFDRIKGKTKQIFSLILLDAMKCKNPAFKEEQEYRVLKTINETEKEKVRFRTNRTSIIPYIELDFSNKREYVVKEIVLGPKSQIDPQILMLFMQNCKYHWKKENISKYIIKSTSSYR